MGERKGQNLYYPPDYDPKVGGLNKFMGTHALRERARKLHMGILIIRFEMPYNIWCDGCNNHIGMGVRYNAEKTKIGMYYSTPVYQFRMKCHLCDNHFEIKTDPGNLDYVIVSGARRQENRWDPTENGQVVPETKETQKKLFDDAMFRLEHKTGDEDVAKLDKPRLGKLVGRNESVWKDDYEANCSLRRNFRKRRKELEESSVNDSLLLAKSSLDLNLLPENEEDRNMASLLALRPSRSIEESQNQTRSKILNAPALPSSSGLLTSFGGLKKEDSLSKASTLTRQSLGITLKRKKYKTNKEIDKSGCNKSNENIEDNRTDVAERINTSPSIENAGNAKENTNNSVAAIIEVTNKVIDVTTKDHVKEIKETTNSFIPKDVDVTKLNVELKTYNVGEIGKYDCEGKIAGCPKEDVKIKPDTDTKETKISPVKNEIELKNISLVCDYSSSGEGSE